MGTSLRRRPATPALVAAVLLLSACGSTLQVSDGTATGSLDGGLEVVEGTTGDGGLGGPDGTVPDGGTATSAPGAVAGGGTAPVGSSGSTGGSTGIAGGPATAGPGTTGGSAGTPATGARKPVQVGFVTFPDVNAAAEQFGGSAETGDQEAQARNAVKWANANGGLNGHQIVPIFFEVELTSAQPYSVTYQEACEFFTVDNKAVAVVFIGNAANDFADCLARKKVALLTSGHFLRDATDYRAIANVITPRELGSDRASQLVLDELSARGVLTSGARLGLLVMDYGAPNRSADRVLAPGVKAKGATLTTYKIPPPTSTPGISSSVSAVQAAALRFASEGVSTVLFLCPGCATFFIQNAQSQGYYPRYVLTSFDTPLGLGTAENARSLESAIGFGWEPTSDIGTYDNPPQVRGNPSREQCRTIQKSFLKDDISEFAALSLCGSVLDLRAFAVRSGALVDGSALVAGAGALGTSYAHAMTFRTALSPLRRDGAAGYYAMKYSASCTCLQYDGALKAAR